MVVVGLHSAFVFAYRRAAPTRTHLQSISVAVLPNELAVSARFDAYYNIFDAYLLILIRIDII